MKVRCSADTNVGLKREVNQDSFGIGDTSQNTQKGYFLIVCDGMGGHTAGEVASRIGVDTIIQHYYHSDNNDCAVSMEQAFCEANQAIYTEGQGSMGTTGVAALLYQDILYVANVGDSRAYLIRDGQISQISRDHSLVAEQVAAGLLTSEQARHANYRNMITRALGYRPEVQIDIFTEQVHVNDMIVLSSDGLHGLVEDDEIAQVVLTKPLDEAVKRLIQMANDRGGTDNITVAIAYVDEVDGIDTMLVYDSNTEESAKSTESSAETIVLGPATGATQPIPKPNPATGATQPIPKPNPATGATQPVQAVSAPPTNQTTQSQNASTVKLSGTPTHPPSPSSSATTQPPSLRIGLASAVIFLVLVIAGMFAFRNTDSLSVSSDEPSPVVSEPQDEPTTTAIISPTVALSRTHTITTTMTPALTQTMTMTKTQTRPTIPPRPNTHVPTQATPSRP